MAQALMEGFPQRLAAIREASGLTQRQLADRLGYSHSWVSKLERGTRKGTHLEVGELLRLAETLRVSPWVFVTGWDRDTAIRFGNEDDGGYRASDIWAWAYWEKPLEGDPAVYWRFSPFWKPEHSRRDLISGVRAAYSRPVEVVDQETGERHIAHVLTEEGHRIVAKLAEFAGDEGTGGHHPEESVTDEGERLIAKLIEEEE